MLLLLYGDAVGFGRVYLYGWIYSPQLCQKMVCTNNKHWFNVIQYPVYYLIHLVIIHVYVGQAELYWIHWANCDGWHFPAVGFLVSKERKEMTEIIAP